MKVKTKISRHEENVETLRRKGWKVWIQHRETDPDDGRLFERASRITTVTVSPPENCVVLSSPHAQAGGVSALAWGDQWNRKRGTHIALNRALMMMEDESGNIEIGELQSESEPQSDCKSKINIGGVELDLDVTDIASVKNAISTVTSEILRRLGSFR